jgi:hypothetical protein
MACAGTRGDIHRCPMAALGHPEKAVRAGPNQPYGHCGLKFQDFVDTL